VDRAGQKKQDYEKTKANFDKKVILDLWCMLNCEVFFSLLCHNLSIPFPLGEHKLKEG